MLSPVTVAIRKSCNLIRTPLAVDFDIAAKTTQEIGPEAVRAATAVKAVESHVGSAEIEQQFACRVNVACFAKIAVNVFTDKREQRIEIDGSKCSGKLTANSRGKYDITFTREPQVARILRAFDKSNRIPSVPFAPF